MGIDFGERRIGVAVSDPTGVLASPHGTVSRRAGKRWPLPALERIARDREVERLIVGLPLDAGGAENEWCARVRDAGDELARRLDIPVDYVDERMTSVRATRSLREAGISRARRRDKALIDAAAAAIILQTYLDRRSGESGTAFGEPASGHTGDSP